MATAEVGTINDPIVSTTTWKKSVLLKFRRNPVGAFSGVLCLFLIFLAVFGPNISPYDPGRIDFTRLQAPNLTHPFGTDNLARDLLSRIITGARNSLGVAFAALAVAAAVGVCIGVLSGYLGGWVDLLTNRILDIMQAYPGLVFVIFAVVIFGRNFAAISIGIGITLIPGVVRIVRSSTLGVKNQQFIEAALSVGNSPARIMYRHVLPNVAAPIIIVASINIGIAILIESGLSFLGFGVSSSVDPSWGRMLNEMRPSWQTAWWTMVVPGAAISVTVVAFNVFGDALRDWLDPRLRGSR